MMNIAGQPNERVEVKINAELPIEWGFSGRKTNIVMVNAKNKLTKRIALKLMTLALV